MGLEVFASIVGFKDLDLSIELILDHHMKFLEDMVNFRFFFHEKYSSQTSAIIHKRHKLASPCEAFNS